MTRKITSIIPMHSFKLNETVIFIQFVFQETNYTYKSIYVIFSLFLTLFGHSATYWNCILAVAVWHKVNRNAHILHIFNSFQRGPNQLVISICVFRHNPIDSHTSCMFNNSKFFFVYFFFHRQRNEKFHFSTWVTYFLPFNFPRRY